MLIYDNKTTLCGLNHEELSLYYFLEKRLWIVRDDIAIREIVIILVKVCRPIPVLTLITIIINNNNGFTLLLIWDKI